MELQLRALFMPCLSFYLMMGSAQAQSCLPVPLPPPEGPPILHLTETATENVVPSLLVTDLVATAQSQSAVTAQRQVNGLMAQASLLAGKVPNVTAVFQDYQTNYIDRSLNVPAHWIASQTLEVRGQSGEDVLALVAQLQTIGLTIQNLGWQVPPNEADAASRKARLRALATLRQDATQAAAVIGMQVKSYQIVDLSGGILPQMPGPMMAEAAMAPPQATADSQAISASVSADVVLRLPTTQKQENQP